MKRISKRLVSSGALDVVATAIPGIRDILVLGKVKSLERQPAADLILVDAPATGHAMTFLSSAQGLLDAARSGPVRTQAADVVELLVGSRSLPGSPRHPARGDAGERGGRGRLRARGPHRGLTGPGHRERLSPRRPPPGARTPRPPPPRSASPCPPDRPDALRAAARIPGPAFPPPRRTARPSRRGAPPAPAPGALPLQCRRSAPPSSTSWPTTSPTPCAGCPTTTRPPPRDPCPADRPSPDRPSPDGPSARRAFPRRAFPRPASPRPTPWGCRRSSTSAPSWCAAVREASARRRCRPPSPSKPPAGDGGRAWSPSTRPSGSPTPSASTPWPTPPAGSTGPGPESCGR